MRALALILLLPGTALAAESHDCIVRPNDTIELTSEEEGVLAEILVDRGAEVIKGQPVARLDSRLQESAVELARIRASNHAAVDAGDARVAFRQQELERRQGLRQKNVSSQAQLDEAEIELRLAELDRDSAQKELALAKAELARAEILLDRRTIRSPVDGVVMKLTASPGEFAHDQAPVMMLAALDPLHVEVYLPVAMFPELSHGQTAEITIGPPFDLTGTARVSAIDTVFDPASNTFGLRLDLPNPDHALPSGIRCLVSFVAGG